MEGNKLPDCRALAAYTAYLPLILASRQCDSSLILQNEANDRRHAFLFSQTQRQKDRQKEQNEANNS